MSKEEDKEGEAAVAAMEAGAKALDAAFTWFFGVPPVEHAWELEQQLRALISERAEAVARLLEADPHQFSSRPCQTCTAVSALLNRPFGCSTK